MKMAIQMQEILNDDFFYALANYFSLGGRQDIFDFINSQHTSLIGFSKLSYEGLYALDSLEGVDTGEVAGFVFAAIGNSFPKIYDALVADYNPLENYFTDREMTDNLDSDSTRTGGYTDTPSGTKTREFIDNGVTGLGTTFESYGDNDFRNISKTKSTGEIDDGFDNYQEQRVYNALTDTGNADRSIEEHRSGNSGIFAKQDLTEREIKLRLRYKLKPILVRMCVDVMSKGVWEVED
jgi:hypothetical protein